MFTKHQAKKGKTHSMEGRQHPIQRDWAAAPGAMKMEIRRQIFKRKNR
jgi:hypothetical protein